MIPSLLNNVLSNNMLSNNSVSGSERPNHGYTVSISPNSQNNHAFVWALIAFLILGALSIPAKAQPGEHSFTLPTHSSKSIAPVVSLKDYPLTKAKYGAGVTTLQVKVSEGLSKDLTQAEERILPLEVWYPVKKHSALHSKATYERYKLLTRSHQPFELQTRSQRDLPIADSDQSFPLVIISHGYTGYRQLMHYLGEYLAERGFVVAAIDHLHSTTGGIKPDEPFSGFLSTLYHRPIDQSQTRTYLLNHPFENGLNRDIQQSLNPEKVALIGYSMGGYGLIKSIGGCYQFSNQTFAMLTGNTDGNFDALVQLLNRCSPQKANGDWQAAIALAPWGQKLNIFKLSSLKNIKTPLLIVGGDQDDTSGYEKGVKSLYKSIPNKHKYLLTYQQAKHNIAPHPLPKLEKELEFDIQHYQEPNWSSKKLNHLNQRHIEAMLNCTLYLSQEDCSLL